MSRHNVDPHRDQGLPRGGTWPIINDLLDGGLSEEQSREKLRALRSDPLACEELARTRMGVQRLHDPINQPDLSDAILDRVHARRRFLPGRTRRWITAGRVAIAAGFIGAIGLASFVQRAAPEIRLSDEPSAVTKIVNAATPRESKPTARVAEAVETFCASLVDTESQQPQRTEWARLSLAPRMRPTDNLRFDLAIDRAGTTLRESSPGHQSSLMTARAVATVGAPISPLGTTDAARSPLLLSRFEPMLVYLRQPPVAGPAELIEAER